MEWPAATGNRERAGQKEGQVFVADAPKAGKTDRLSADEWRMLLNMRFGSLRRLAVHRSRQGTLTEAHAHLIRKEMTWARLHRGDRPEAVLTWLVMTWPLHSSRYLATMTAEDRHRARKEQEAAFRALMKWATRRKTWLRPLAIGNRLNVSPEERDLLKLRTVRYAGQTDDIMEAEQRQRKREAKAAKRRAEGKPTRAEWRAGCKSTTKPWEQEGISRRTWERRLKKAAEQSTISVSQVVPAYKSNTPTSLYIGDTLATVAESGRFVPDSTVPRRALDGAPDRASARVVWMAQATHLRARSRLSATATKITATTEAQRGPLTAIQGRGHKPRARHYAPISDRWEWQRGSFLRSP
jgi:hypothetical protein